MKRSYLISALVVSFALGAGCNEKKEFNGGNGKRNAPQTNTPPNPQPPPPPPPPQCRDHQQAVGAHLVFLVDNSSSMSETDCPGGQRSMQGVICSGQTDRERAILTSFDVLAKFRADNRAQAESLSTVSVAKFTPAQAGDTRVQMALPPTNTETQGRQALQSSLQFVRQPLGDTPYRNAVKAAEQAFSEVDRVYGTDGRPRVAIMVTDGEATDRNPAEVRDLVSRLRSRGIQWYTVMVNQTTDRQARLARHRQVIEQQYSPAYARQIGQQYWWQPYYQSVGDYMKDIASLPGAMSDQVIEISSAATLQQTILERIVINKVTCR